MKNTILLILLFVSSLATAQIQFTQDNWQTVLAHAKSQNRYVFVDAYTTWCGPCKVMDRDVFAQPNVGDFYNANFINVKLNMEQGDGPAVARQFGVYAYPTYLFLSPEGELVHRSQGIQAPDRFIELGKAGLDPKRQWTRLSALYNKGDRSPEVLRNYTIASYETGNRIYSNLAEKYLETQSDWTTYENMEFLLRYADDFDDKPMQFVLNNRETFNAAFGAERVNKQLKSSISSKLFSPYGPKLSLEEVDKTFQKTFPGQAEQYGLEFRILFYDMAKDRKKFMETVEQYMDTYSSSDWSELNSYAWRFYEYADSNTQLQKALSWALMSVSLESNFYNTDTVAALYYKLGDQQNARRYAKKAIKYAQETGEDFSPTMDLMLKINQMN